MLLYLDRGYFCLENFSPVKSHEETAWLASNGKQFGKDKNNFSLPAEIAAEAILLRTFGDSQQTCASIKGFSASILLPFPPQVICNEKVINYSNI